ncbi:MAG: hypothetical protein DRI74_08235 [Bacteroidetes bacterium]|nr:MAG: hypothetical protein DRI74_08235 [Bacteroidota bacterium]
MKKIVFFLFLSIGLFIVNTKTLAQTDTIPDDFCISTEEYQLYQLINDYRKAFALPQIALSKSLSYVAITHARDLSVNFNPDTICNMHSWSDKGRWKPICFPSEQSKKNNIKFKAKEIIGYSSEAYEITYWSNVENSPRQILSFWRENKISADLLINRGNWENKSWKAIGIGIEDGYAVVWLGEGIDYEVSTPVCGTSIQVLNNASPEYKAKNTQKQSTENPVYYITIGSYKNRKDGVNAVRSYKEMGYPKAILVETANKFRVAIDYFTNKKEADRSLKKYAQKFKGAWILTL